MSVPKNLIAGTLGRFALLFNAPDAAQANWNDAVDCWFRLLGDMPEAEFSARSAALARTLTRFPVPADFNCGCGSVDQEQKQPPALDGQAVGAMAGGV